MSNYFKTLEMLKLEEHSIINSLIQVDQKIMKLKEQYKTIVQWITVNCIS
jgi:hypothetical protein